MEIGIQDFLYSQGINKFVDQYNIDGTPCEKGFGRRRLYKITSLFGISCNIGGCISYYYASKRVKNL